MKKRLVVTALWLASAALLGLTVLSGRSPAQKDDALAARAEAILKKRCAECHSKAPRQGKKPKGGLDLWDPAHLSDQDREVTVLVPGSPEKSGLIQRLRPREPGEIMPPKKAGPPLSDEEVNALTAWVKAGGKRATARIETRRADDRPPARLSGGDKEGLARKAREILRTHCHRCHGVDFNGQLDVMKRPTLVAERKDEDPYVTPGDPAKSSLFARFGKSMPPKSIRQRPTAEDRAVIKQWIDAGAPDFAGVAPRKFVRTRDVILLMRDYLKAARGFDRPYLKFFTMTHLHNDPTVPEEDLREYNAALSKVINSLSWKPRIVVPKAIDKEGTIFVVDIRDLDWDRKRNGVNLWRAVLAAYPYGLRYDEDANDQQLRQADRDLYRCAGKVVPYVRGDWFVATAARPPLYHTLLQLPNTAAALERLLDVDTQENFRRNKLARAGFNKSGVSGQNRMVERHDIRQGAYWKSDDFKEHKGNAPAQRRLAARANIINYPLGPIFPGNEFNEQAFIQDGGEIIFNLPNGLQAYFLVDGKGNRIDQGPEEVVSDPLKTSGTPAIVNGLSCMHCHMHGMIRFTDEVRDGTAVGGNARVKVQDLFPTPKDMEVLVRRDEKKFLEALDEAIGPFIKVGADKDRPIRSFRNEPVGVLARRYKLLDLGIETVAAEVGFEGPKALQALIRRSKGLRELGLGALARDGGTIKRFEWERIRAASSLFQRVASELEIGTPYIVIK
jgi:serine/threonine-protein kinase